MLKHPYFLLLKEIFYFRGISMIDAYLCGVTKPTLKSYKSKWKRFIYLVEKNNNNNDCEYKNLCPEIYLEFLNWAFVEIICYF
jgi:hypothetical protein